MKLITPAVGVDYPVASAERVIQPGCHLPAHDRPTHLLILYQAPDVIVHRQRGSQQQHDRFSTGDMGVYPAGEYGLIRTDGPVNNIVITLHHHQLDQFADTRLNLAKPRLQDTFKTHDPLINAVGQALVSEPMRNAGLSLLYRESLTDTLCYHLLQHYTLGTADLRPEAGKLSAGVLRRIDAFLDARIAEAESITVKMLAELANCSPYHFSRLFKNATGCSPYQYVLAYKAERAKAWLRNYNLPIADIAYRLGFSSPGHFDRFFRNQTGFNPRAYRKTSIFPVK